MSFIFSRPPRPDISTRRLVVSAISVVTLITVLGVVMYVTLRTPLKDDIAWLLYVARRWMMGRELYVDLVEVNPPLIVWISAVPIGLARWLNVDPQLVAMPVFVAAVLGCAWWTASLLRAHRALFRDPLPVFAITGVALLILPAADLGQREHLLVAAFLPYLVLHARSLDRKSVGLVASVLAGALAGLGCALKPRYAGVFAGLECLALMNGLRPWRALPLAAGATLFSCAGLIAILCPAYLQRAVPMALALYGATDVPFFTLLHDSTILICGEAVVVGLLCLRPRNLPDFNLMLTLVTFAVISTIVCFVDGKDWYYHRIPATVITVLALAIWITAELAQRQFTMRWPAIVAGLAIGVFYASSIHRLASEAAEAVEPKQTTVDRLEHILRAEHARTYIAFSEWIALGFPVVNETGVAWASRFDSMWALKGEIWRARFDPAADQEWPIARWVSHDFINGCPDIAVVDTRETTRYISVLSAADAAFARAWSRYRPIASFDGLVVYRRSQAGCRDVWVATDAKPVLETRAKPQVQIR